MAAMFKICREFLVASLCSFIVACDVLPLWLSVCLCIVMLVVGLRVTFNVAFLVFLMLYENKRLRRLLYNDILVLADKR